MSETTADHRPAPLRCVVLVPFGPGHKDLVREAQASVEFAFSQNPGPFAEVIVLTLDDSEGKHGRSRRRNDGIAWALANGYDWIFFLDADDLMAANAFGEVTEHIADSEAIFGLIVEQTGTADPQLRPGQLGATSQLGDILRHDPYLTLQMGHFVRAQSAAAIGFDTEMDTGEDFKYYLELWRRFRCRKIERALFVNRRGLHSHGPRAADGRKWRDAVARVFAEFCSQHSLQVSLRHDGREAHFLIRSPMEPAQAHLSRGRFLDAAELDFLRTLLPARPTVVDIAPGIGNHLVYCGLHMQAGRIIPMGADAGDAAALRRNIELNGLKGKVDLSRLESSIGADLATGLPDRIDLVRIGDAAGLSALQSLSGLVSDSKPVLFVSVPAVQVDGLLLWAGERDYRVLRSSARQGLQSHVLVPATHPALPAATAMPGLKAFVITLLDMPESVAVGNRALESAQRHGIPAEIFPATGKSGARAELDRLGLKVQRLDPSLSNSDAVLGLFVTSFRIWQKIAEELDYGIVVEHDAVFTAPLPDLRGKGDIINLGKPSWGSYNLKAVPGVYELFSKNPQPSLGIVMPGAHAYLVSKAGARRLMQKALESGAAPCDLFLNNVAFPDIREIYPWVAVAVDSFSTIQKQRGSVSKHNFSTGYRLLADASLRVAVVTPYYKEPREYLERCLASVRTQTHGAEHIVIADGHPQDWLDTAGVRHIRLDREHADYGNTPRSIGAQLAIAEGFDAVAFLDADNWFEPDHVATCVDAMRQAPSDFVSAQRHWVRADGSRMPYRAGEDVDGSHVDTNCLFLGRGAFHTVSRWLTMPKPMVLWGDRFYLASLRQEGLREARTTKPTVNYLCTWSGVFRSVGETPPPYAKEGVPIKKMLDWLQSLQPEELSLAKRLSGCDPVAFFRERDAKQSRTVSPAGTGSKMVVVSFYTKTWTYETSARTLMSSCRTLQLPFDIQEVADTGKWRTNTALKPAYIRRMLDRHEHILWLDCDGRLLKAPVECLNHPEDVDIMACPHRTVAGRDWHVGVLSIRSNPRTRAFVDAWIAQVSRHIEHDSTDEFAFIQLMKDHPEVRFQALSDNYHVVMQPGTSLTGAVYGLGLSRDPDKLNTYQARDRLAYL